MTDQDPTSAPNPRVEDGSSFGRTAAELATAFAITAAALKEVDTLSTDATPDAVAAQVVDTVSEPLSRTAQKRMARAGKLPQGWSHNLTDVKLDPYGKSLRGSQFKDG